MSESAWATSGAVQMPAAPDHALDGYVHPTGDGNLHVPATGTTNANKALVAGSTPGSASWQQYSYAWLTNKPTLGTAAARDVPTSGNATATQCVIGSDTRLADARPASDVYAWAKTPSKPTYTATEVGAAASTHSHAIPDVSGLQSALDTKLTASGYTAADVLGKLKTVDGAGSGLDADLLDGNDSAAFAKLGADNVFVGTQTADGGLRVTQRGVVSNTATIDMLTQSATTTEGLGSPSTRGWSFGARSAAYTVPGEQNDLILDYWDGSNLNRALRIDSVTRSINFFTTPTAAGMLLARDVDLAAVAKSGSYSDLTNRPTLGTAAAKDVAASGDATATQVVIGNDSRLTNSRPASDVYAWAKATSKPAYTAAEVGAATSSHTHTPSQIGAQPEDADLTAIAAISSGAGLLKRTGAGSWSIDTTAYLSGDIASSQQQNDTSFSSAAWSLKQLGGYSSVVALSADQTLQVDYQSHGGSILSITNNKCSKIDLPKADTVANGGFPFGSSVNVINSSPQLFVVSASENGGVILQSGGVLTKNLILPGATGAAYRFISYSSGVWRFSSTATPSGHVIDMPGTSSAAGQCAYHAIKLQDTHASTHPIGVEAVGGGGKGASGYIGRSGAYVRAAVSGGFVAGSSIECIVGDNTGTNTIIGYPIGGYYMIAYGGANGDSSAPFYSPGLATSLSSYVAHKTSKTSNSTWDAGTNGTPIGSPGQRPNLANGYGGGSAVVDGTGSGQYGAGPGLVRLIISSPYPQQKCIFSLGVNGANGDTSFYDFSSSAATVTRTGSVQHSSAKTSFTSNTIWLNGGYLSVTPASLANFSAYLYARISIKWMYMNGAGASVLFDSRTGTGSVDGFCVTFDPILGKIYLYAREYIIAEYAVSAASLNGVWKMVDVEIIPGATRAIFRLSLAGAVVATGVSTSIGAIYATDRLTFGCSNDVGGGLSTASDYIAGIAIYIVK